MNLIENIQELESNSKVIWSLVNLLGGMTIEVNKDNYTQIHYENSTPTFDNIPTVFIYTSKDLWLKPMEGKKFLINEESHNLELEIIEACAKFFNIPINESQINHLKTLPDIYFFGVLKIHSPQNPQVLLSPWDTSHMFTLSYELENWNTYKSIHKSFGKYNPKKYHAFRLILDNIIYSFLKTGANLVGYMYLVFHHFQNHKV